MESKPRPRAAAHGAPRKRVASAAVIKPGASKTTAAAFVAFMKREPVTGEVLISKVRKGYPSRLVKQAGDYFKVPEKRLLGVLGISASTLHRRTTGDAPLDSAASERLHRIAIIARETTEAFGDEGLAREWMLRPNHALGETAPLDLLDTEIGATAVRRVLVAIAEGGVV